MSIKRVQVQSNFCKVAKIERSSTQHNFFYKMCSIHVIPSFGRVTQKFFY